MPQIKIQSIRVTNFKPKESSAELEVSYTKDDKPQKISKEYILKKPLELLTRLILDVKSKDKILIDDPTLNPLEHLEKYSPLIIVNQDEVEEKIYNFLKNICEKAAQLKKTREATKHMRLYDEFKTAALVLEK